MSNPLSSISYTNKDFNSIYPELLELAKKLASKWDPTISNESDPGVVLIKTDAIIGDKNNYNIDKNILEAFPETVTQDVNARKLYKQLAYYMPWYKSATTDITFKYIGEDLPDMTEFSIPKYTMISDVSAECVYTLIEEPVFNQESTTATAKAIEGTVVDFKINGSDIITLANINNKNRVYLDDYSVAENGIFITNVDTTDHSVWQKVDNLLITPLGTKCYEFGVDSTTQMCYIEFPQDISNLIDAGINIKYVISNGIEGNVSALTIERFYQESSIDINGETLPLNNETFEVFNASAAVNGADPQTISDAYLAYKKTAGTFNTLVTIRDYINAIYSSGLVSNGIVSDRTTDIQTSYSIMTDDLVNPEKVFQTRISDAYASTIAALKDIDTQYTKDGVTVKLGDLLEEGIKLYNTYIEEEPREMNAFDLKLYLLHNSGTIANIDQYESSFNVEPIHFDNSPITRQVMDYISEQKCVQHDFKEIKPDTPCMYQNSFPINIKIIANSKLTDSQINEVKRNIIKSLFNVVCSRAQEFGVEPDYDVIYDCIVNSDERIKTIIMDDFKFITYAIYWDTDAQEFRQIPLNIKEYDDSNIITVIKDVTDLSNYVDISKNAYWSLARRNATQFVYIGTDSKSFTEDNTYIMKDTVVNPYDILKFDTVENKFRVYSTKLKDFQRQILLKSILAGRTPLFIANSPFRNSISDNEIAQAEVEKISTASMISPYTTQNHTQVKDINWEGEKISIHAPILPTTSDTTKMTAAYNLKENENIRLLAPSFTTKRSFSNYIKFILQLQEESGITQKLGISSANELEINKYYYMSTEDWVKVANNIIKIYNNIVDLVTEDNPYTEQLSSWKESFTKFVGQEPEMSDPQYTVANVSTRFSNNITYYEQDGEAYKATSDQTPISGKTYYYAKQAMLGQFTKYIEGGSWHIATDDKAQCSGKIDNKVTMSGGSPVSEISQYDPVYQTLRSKTDGLETIELKEQVRSYSIPSETDYKLKKGESITFFWREEDGDDIPYRYECYRGIDRSEETSTKKSPIIKANFSITGEALGTTPFISLLSDEGEIVYGDAGYSHVSGLYGDNDLSGTKNIDIREMNQKILDRINGVYKQQNRIYFISNKIETSSESGVNKQQFVLELKNTGSYNSGNSIVNTFRYTLQDNEFFIYTSRDGSEFEMLSAGTLIGIDTISESEPDNKENIRFSVDALSIDKIQSEGVLAFYDKSLTIPKNYTMFCREQQIYSIVGGDTINLTIEDRQEMYEANKNSIYGEFIETKDTSPQPNTEYYIFDTSTQKYKQINVVDTFDSDKTYFVRQISRLCAVPYFCSWLDTYVKGFSLKYTSNNSVITLPKLDIQDDPDCIWVGRSYLNINCSTDDTQTVYAYVPDYVTKEKCSTQNIIMYTNEDEGLVVYPHTSNHAQSDTPFNETEDTVPVEGKVYYTLNETVYEIADTSEGFEESVIYYEQTEDTPNYSEGLQLNIKSSIFLDKVGGHNVDISYLDGVGERHPVTLYLYETNTTFDEAPYHITESGEVEVEMGVVTYTPVEVESFQEGVDYYICEADNVYVKTEDEEPAQNVQYYVQSTDIYEKDVSFIDGSDCVLSITNPSDTCSFKFYAGNDELISLNSLSTGTGDGEDEYLQKGTYYFLMSSNAKKINFEFSGTPLGGERLTISKILKSSLNPLLEEIDNYKYLFETSDLDIKEVVFSQLRRYDYDGVFKYDYQPEEETYIKDPLSANSFFDVNHIANDYTIPRCELRLSDATNSKITIVNNR